MSATEAAENLVIEVSTTATDIPVAVGVLPVGPAAASDATVVDTREATPTAQPWVLCYYNYDEDTPRLRVDTFDDVDDLLTKLRQFISQNLDVEVVVVRDGVRRFVRRSTSGLSLVGLEDPESPQGIRMVTSIPGFFVVDAAAVHNGDWTDILVLGESYEDEDEDEDADDDEDLQAELDLQDELDEEEADGMFEEDEDDDFDDEDDADD